jgi:hypothetical protein
VSELYASMLMIGVTLSVGSIVVFSAVSQFGLAANAESLGASLQNSASGVEVTLVYAAVTSSSACQNYQGSDEGTSLAVSLYNFGASDFRPTELVVNDSVFVGDYATLQPGSMSVYTVTLGSCAHSSGQTILALDALGDEVQFGS